MSGLTNNMFNATYSSAGLFLLYNTSFLLFKIYKRVYSKQKKQITVLSETDDYIEQSKTQFFKTLQSRTDSDTTFLNSNTNTEFYSKQSYQAAIHIDKNPLEQEWKHRILFEHTPRGNVIMYYDPYKLAFAYYCDTSSMPYKILNAIAMKYVIRFHCLDLFVDNENTPENCLSPLIKTLFMDEPAKNKQNSEQKGINLKNAPFVKLKKYDTSTKKLDNKDGNEKSKQVVIHNNFVCIGKIINFSFINKVEKKVHSLNGFNSNLLNNLSAENKLQKQVLSYKDFKGRSAV